MATAPAVQINNLVKEFIDPRTKTAVRAVNDIDLEIREGEFFAMLGPSGCGKTTTLRVIAGFEEPTSGELLLRGNSMRGIPSFHRPVNTVFQDYALFPHMTVLQNVMFGLRMARVPDKEARKRSLEALDMVRLPNVERRKPLQLSGGQRQRVALARALVNRPSVLLLDEPLGALDLKLRRAMQFELKRLQQQVGITFIYVTHDQEEALTMADRIAVMNAGQVLQVGRADDIYERPSDRFVADFIGETNFLACVLESKAGSSARVRLEDGTVLSGVLRDPDMAVGVGVALALRPEKLAVEDVSSGEPPALAGAQSALPGTVAGVHYLGTDARYLIEVPGGARVVARVQNQQHGFAGMLAEGTPVRLTWLTEYGSVLA